MDWKLGFPLTTLQAAGFLDRAWLDSLTLDFGLQNERATKEGGVKEES